MLWERLLKKILTWLFWGPVAVLVIGVAVANRHSVKFSLDPLSTSDPLFSAEMPLFILLLAAVLVGLMIGGAASWINQGKYRRAAREGLHDAARWRRQAESAEHRADSAPPGMAQLPSPDPR